MSKKKLLLNLLALSCLVNGGVGATEKSDVKNPLTPPQAIAKSVSNQNKVENKIEKTDSFFINNKSNIISGLIGGVGLGTIAGVGVGLTVNYQKNKTIDDLKKQLTEKNTEITNLQTKLNTQPGDEELKKQIDELKTKNQTLQAEKDEAAKQVTEGQIRLAAKDKEIEKLKQNNEALINNAAGVGEGIKKQLKEANEALNDKQKELDNKIATVKSITEENEKLKEFRNLVMNKMQELETQMGLVKSIGEKTSIENRVTAVLTVGYKVTQMLQAGNDQYEIKTNKLDEDTQDSVRKTIDESPAYFLNLRNFFDELYNYIENAKLKKTLNLAYPELEGKPNE